MKTLLIFLFISFSSITFAESIQLEGKKLGKFPIRILGTAKYQNATLGDEDGETIKPRHLNGLGAEALGGLVLGNFIIGGGGDYMYYAQASDVADDSNMTGSATNFFGVAGISVHRFLLLGKYIFQSTYKVNKEDDNGEKLEFTDPEGSFAATLVYRLGKRSFLNVEYVKTTYTEGLEDKKMKFQSVGLSYGVMF